VIVLVAHGLGHVMEPMAAVAPRASPFADRPWVFGGVTAASPVGRPWSVLWLLAMIGFVAGGLGLWFHTEWWRPALIASSAVSLVAVLPWWGPMPRGSYIGAVLVGLAVLAGLLLPWGDRVLAAIG